MTTHTATARLTAAEDRYVETLTNGGNAAAARVQVEEARAALVKAKASAVETFTVTARDNVTGALLVRTGRTAEQARIIGDNLPFTGSGNWTVRCALED